MADDALKAQDLWSSLQKTSLPLVLYGMGNGADKILDILTQKGIEISDIFASDGFVRGHFFHGKKVLSYAEIREKYERFIVLLAFGSSLPEVMERIRRMADEVPLFAPDVPVCGGPCFDMAFYNEHQEKIREARSLFADARSKDVYDAIVSYKLTGDIATLAAADSRKDDALSSLLTGGYSAYADLGAYTGDTVREALAFFPTVQKIVAFEPSPKIFAKLSAYLETQSDKAVSAFPLCAWDRDETRILTDGQGRNTTLTESSDITKTANGARLHPVSCGTLDGAVPMQKEHLLIKYDVEGAEREAILGSKQTIADNRTELIVSLYHKSADLFELPLLIHSLMPHHKLYLRKHPYIPAWDVNLYVTE